MTEGLQFYQDLHTGTVVALVVTSDGTPKLEEVHKGRPCYITYEVAQKVNLSIVKGSGPLDTKKYRAITKEEAQEIDRNTQYSMYGVFSSATGMSLVGRFFEEMGEEGRDWFEVPHKNLQPSLAFHADVAYILADQDFYHAQCAAKAFGIEVINKVISMQRKYSLHEIVETSSLYEEAPKIGANLISVTWKSDQWESEYCSGCTKKREEED